MGDNLVFLINKLSQQIVSQQLENDRNLHSSKQKSERYFKKCVKKVSQKGYDVLLKKSCHPPPEDPCVTDYGGNWSPFTILSDYGRELQTRKGERFNEILLKYVKSLEEKQYDCVNELIKFLLLLKKPCVDSAKHFQKEITFNGPDFAHNSVHSFSLLCDDYASCSDSLSRNSSYKKALQYEESWTKQFDIKFQILGEFSKKNILVPDKVSLDSLFTARSLNKSQSQSNSFVFTDFFTGKGCNSEKNFTHFNSSTFSESFLLDSFVDNPITHKLPSIDQKHFSKTNYLIHSNGHINKGLSYSSQEKQMKDSIDSIDSDRMLSKEKSSQKSSEIKLKRNSNCSHSLSILYKKSTNCESQDLSVPSNESLILLKNKAKGKVLKDVSKEIILGLWEQEQALIKDFKPELAASFPTLRMISTAEFVDDVKYLLTGVSSATFNYDKDTDYFRMEYGTCLEDVTPESLFNFSKEFLDIGNCYMKLNLSATAIGKNNFDTCTTVSQAFWKSIFDFLELHYSMVLEIPTSASIMALKSCSRDLHEMITTVAEISKVLRPTETLPQGGELLSYLLQVAEKLSKPCVKNIIFGILQNCCNVYFMCILQTWMFKGHLEKQNNEFFIDCRRQKIKTRSRSYYNSFYIAHDKIPSFLQGYEDSIFNCGKSVHFLKLFNTEDKFCQILDKADYPTMYLCLIDEHLEKLEKDFKDYGNRVIGTCGESISIKSIRAEEKEREKCFIDYVREYKKIQTQQRELMKLRQLEDLKAKKEIQNELLNKQKTAIQIQKERKKFEEEMEKNNQKEESRRAAAEKEKLLNEEKSYIKSYYDGLLKALEKQLTFAKLKKENLKKLLYSKSIDAETNQEFMDALNANESQKVDEEGNITEELDVNSNASSLPSENLIRVIDGISNPTSRVTVESCQTGAVTYDENSNPSSKFSEGGFSFDTLSQKSESMDNQQLASCVSHKTIAAQEAERNKCKVLKSEFGLFAIKEPTTELNPQSQKNSLTDLERNRRRVLESEYEILRNTSGHTIKAVRSETEITKENAVSATPVKVNDTSDKLVSFDKVELERKLECTDLANPPEQKCSYVDASTKSGSSSSFLTPSNDILSEENASIVTAFEQEVTPSLPEDCEVVSMLVNVNYQNALAKDANISHHKLCYEDIFYSLKEPENETLPCTDFMNFQRYLKRSVLLPLKIQEKLANDALLKHLLKGENLLSHLKSLRGYFFLNDGEFGRSFTYNTFRSLAKCTEPHQFFERSNLSNIVNEALNYTIHNCEPNSQNLSFQIVKMPPFLNHSSHDVLSPFELSYKVDWPLNVILTEKALNKYKMVFRFLLKLKRISWTLNENFLFLNSHYKNKRLDPKVLLSSPHYHKIQIFRHAMTQVMITLDDYIFSSGVQFPWIFFLTDLETTENIDHLYQKHVRYIKDVLTRCFLSKNSADLLDCIHNLIELALKFHYTTISSVLKVVEGKYEHPKFEVLKTTFQEFCTVIKTFLTTLKEKISANQVMRFHYVLVEKFDLKLT